MACQKNVKRRKRGSEKDMNKGYCDTCDVPESEDDEASFTFHYMSLSAKERFNIGHDFDSLVQACTFRGRDCRDEKYLILD